MKAFTLILLTAGAFAINARALDTKSPQPVVRTILEKHDQSGVPNKEIVAGSASFPPSSSIGFHTHPGDEAGFVTQGSIVLKVQGQPDRTLTAGQSFFNMRGAIHSVVAGPEGATVMSNWIVDKGAPLATPVP